MHELSVSSAIVDTVVRHAEGRRVTAVRVRLGRLRQVVPGSLAFYFELVSRETVCYGARLQQEDVIAVGATALAFVAPSEAGSQPTATAAGPHAGGALTPAQRRVATSQVMAA